MTRHAGTTVIDLTTWQFASAGTDSSKTVRLPHDAMLAEPRSSLATGGAEVAYFEGGAYVYRTTWVADVDPKVLPYAAIRFEGVQGDADVYVNRTPVGTIRSGYSEFEFPIDTALVWGESNEIVVEVDNAKQPASRWYPGSGLYRPVKLLLRPRTHFATDGIRLRTRSEAGDSATVDIEYLIENADDSVEVSFELIHNGVVTAVGRTNGVQGRVSMAVPDARLWSAERPHLYELVSRVTVDGSVIDERRERVGLRTVSVTAQRGLLINDVPVKLAGACIHHDNGPLGAATHRAAEFRRIRLLKEAGFNAIRSAHNPMSRHLLDACDEIGMYVLDELADYWEVRKTPHDAAWRFPDTWREDADQMVEKDRNRASVIMYASGNEIPETATPEGVALAREITQYLHRIDPDRPVTLAVNLFLNTLVSMDKSPYKPTVETNDEPMAGSTEANVMINQIGRMMNFVSKLPRADKASRDAFAEVDVAGYNYGLGRYRRDVRAYPDRVILGTETLPGDVARAWKLVNEHPAVIGDFVWTGWEYLGETGVGVWVPGKRAGLAKPYPYLIAGPGMFDLTGHPDTSLRLAQAAWGRLDAPAIGVRPVNLSGAPVVRSAWRTTDAVESWSWRGCEGRKAEIEVYSTDDHVELWLNGRRVGRRRAGRRRGFLARFAVPYEPGTLTAVGYRAGVETTRTSLTSASGPVHVTIEGENRIVADGDDLLFAAISLVGGNGEVEMLADELVEISVSGPGELVGYGTAAPSSVESFLSSSRTTYRGRALAVIRSTGEPGQIIIRATAATRGTAELVAAATAFATPTRGAESDARGNDDA